MSSCFTCKEVLTDSGITVILNSEGGALNEYNICDIQCIAGLDLIFSEKYCMYEHTINSQYLFALYSNDQGESISRITCMECPTNKNFLQYDTPYCCSCKKALSVVKTMRVAIGVIGVVLYLTCSHDCARKIRRILKKTCSEMCHTCEKTLLDSLRCSKCRLTSYCNRECQRKDWPNHKKSCNH